MGAVWICREHCTEIGDWESASARKGRWKCNRTMFDMTRRVELHICCTATTFTRICTEYYSYTARVKRKRGRADLGL